MFVYQYPQTSNKVYQMRKFNKNTVSFQFIYFFILSAIKKWMHDFLNKILLCNNMKIWSKYFEKRNA